MKTRVETAADALEAQLERSGVKLSRTDVLELALVTLMAGDTHLESTLSLGTTTRLLNGLRVSEPNVVAPVGVD
jgi:hypothetical protein